MPAASEPAAPADGARTAVANAASPPRRRWPWLLLPLCLLALVRLLWLDLDPPAAMGEPTIMDEGLWADSARGEVLFGDRFADDLGEGCLMAPLHTWLLTGSFELFGVGLWQTRLVSALASIATAVMLGSWLLHRRGAGAAALAIGILGVTQLLDWHGRMGLLESEQGAWITASFCLLFALRPGPGKALLAGLCMAAAMATKPNTVDYGVLPLAIAFLVTWRGRRGSTAMALAAVLGGLLGLAALMLPMLLAHGDEFAASALAESGLPYYSFVDHLLRLGLSGASESTSGQLARWQLLRYAPAATLGTWLLLIARQHRATDAAGHGGERALLTWFLVTLLMAEISYQHVTRRYVLAAIPAAVLAAMFVAARPQPLAARATGLRRWLTLLAVPALLCKPLFANAVATLLPFDTLRVPSRLEASANPANCIGGWLWLSVLLLPWWLARRRVDTAAIARPLLRLGPAVVAIAGLLELSQLGCLPPHRRTVLEAQQRLAALVDDGSTVFGMHASTLVQPLRVHAVRRVIPGEHWSAPRGNADAFERLQPRFLIDYLDPAAQEMGDLIARGFAPVETFALLPQRSGKPCYRLQLWQRR